MNSVTPGAAPATPLDTVLVALEQGYRVRASTLPLVGRVRPAAPKASTCLQMPTTSVVMSLFKSRAERRLRIRSAISAGFPPLGFWLTLLRNISTSFSMVLGLTVGFADKIKLLAPALQKGIVIAGIVYFELVLVSLLVLFWYLLQARFRYPFLHFQQIGNTWPWFYYASISAGVSRWPIQFPRQLFRSGVLYAEDLVRFADRVVSENETEELRLELQQYFLLLSYQGYVNQFSLRLTNLFFYGFAGSLASGLILSIWAVAK